MRPDEQSPEDEPGAEERFERGIRNALNWTIRNWGEIEVTTSIGGEFSPIYLWESRIASDQGIIICGDR